MEQSIVRAQSPEEREYARYLAEVEVRRRTVADLQAELAALKLALGRFEVEYHARVGSRFAELDRIRLSIDEYERRIAALQANADIDPADVEREVRQDFGRRHEEVRGEEEEAQRYEQAYQREQERPRLPPETEEEVKRLYRELAKRFHPDLARTDDERLQRDTVMRRVNSAFEERDIAALRAISQDADVRNAEFEHWSIGEKLVWAIREVARLDGAIADLRAALADVRASETHRLWSRQEAGEAVVDVLEADLRDEIRGERDRLADLIATYRHVLGRRSP